MVGGVLETGHECMGFLRQEMAWSSCRQEVNGRVFLDC